MKIKDLDITESIRSVLPNDSFLFNPSIAHIRDDIYLISVRSFIADRTKERHEEPNLKKNSQHPWSCNWKGDEDVTYLLPVTLKENKIEPIITGEWPLRLPFPDLRIFSFMRDGTRATFVLTFNESFEGYQDILIRGGDSCDDWCFIIGWGYLLIDVNTLNYDYLPADNPLCMNISNQIDKNWSLWSYKSDDLIYLMISYGLTPIHNAFTFKLSAIIDGEMIGGNPCRMITPRPGKELNLFGELEKYHDNKLFVSLSTPAYEIKNNVYQAVGHIKVQIDYLKQLKDNSLLKKFSEKYVMKANRSFLHDKFIYLMFIYRFKVVPAKSSITQVDEKVSAFITLNNPSHRLSAVVTHTSPAMILKVDEYDYFLNFPSGMSIQNNKTIISYGDADKSSHLLFLSNKMIDKLVIPIRSLEPRTFPFIYAEKDSQGNVVFIE